MNTQTETAPRQLTAKQRLWVDEYLTCWNATEAARRSGYHGNANVLGVQGATNLRNPKIQALITKRLKAHQLSSDRILARMGEMGMANVADFLNEQGSFDIAKLKAKGYLVKKIKTRRVMEGKGDEAQEVELQEIELIDTQAALTTLGKNKHLWGGDESTIALTMIAQIAPIFMRFVPLEKHAELAQEIEKSRGQLDS